MNIDVGTTSVIMGILLANIAAILGAFISTKVSIAKLEVLVGRLEKDTDALFAKLRDVENKK